MIFFFNILYTRSSSFGYPNLFKILYTPFLRFGYPNLNKKKNDACSQGKKRKNLKENQILLPKSKQLKKKKKDERNHI